MKIIQYSQEVARLNSNSKIQSKPWLHMAIVKIEGTYNGDRSHTQGIILVWDSREVIDVCIIPTANLDDMYKLSDAYDSRTPLKSSKYAEKEAVVMFNISADKTLKSRYAKISASYHAHIRNLGSDGAMPGGWWYEDALRRNPKRAKSVKHATDEFSEIRKQAIDLAKRS